ncbi:MAG TPA: lmo0937 family membrane protein [Candidatus Bathyarchaeia archaeon]|nr:lmo0937 family membrane protein [Candidatus Bathyarchaeia archaeon]
MLWTIIVILFVLWLIGLLSSYTFGGLLHLLLIVAVVLLVVRLIQGRPAV